MFDPIWKLVLGLFTGILFGILLQKGGVAKYRVILGQFLLKDWTVVKVMGTAVVVGMIGIYALLPTGMVSLHIKPLQWGGIIFGGLMFGVGMSLLGYCSGTGVAACGEGRRDAERYYILNEAFPGETFAGAVRDQWGIENSCHWQLDVTFGEDQCRIRKGHGNENFSTLRRTALSLLKQEKPAKCGVKNKRLNAGWDDSYMEKVLFSQ